MTIRRPYFLAMAKSLSREEWLQWLMLIFMITLYQAVFFLQDHLPLHGVERALFFIAYFPFYVVLLIGLFEHFGGGLRLKNMGLRLSLGQGGIKYWSKFFALVFLGLLFILNLLHLFKLEIVLAATPDTFFGVYNNLVAPIPEEILYRCILCTIVANRFGWRTAVVTSSLLFGVAHLIPPGSSGHWTIPFFYGFVCSWLFYKSRTILLPLTFHIGGNLFSVLLSFYPTLWDQFTSWVIVV